MVERLISEVLIADIFSVEVKMVDQMVCSSWGKDGERRRAYSHFYI